VDWDTLPLPTIALQHPAQKVAVIGSGPAGLSAAYFLARLGYPVTVFEALAVAGGMLRSGIPDYRLPPAILDREIRYMQRLGVDIKLGSPIGDALSVDELFHSGFKAVFAATGTHADARLGVPGEDAAGVVPAIGFLRQVNLEGTAPVGADLLVIGGGAVAMDAARTARRLGAARVRVVCLEQRADMPAWPAEVQAALDEGVEIHNGWGPRELIVQDGKVAGARLERCSRVLNDASAFAPEYDPTVRSEQSADMVIVAIGQRPDSSWARGSKDLPVDARGYIEADPRTFATRKRGFFAGGEVHSGPSVVVRAVANGHEAAISMDRWLRGEDVLGHRPLGPQGKTWNPIGEGTLRAPRARMAELERHQRGGFEEIELGFTAEQAAAEARRCVDCGTCSECMRCVASCKAQAIDHSQKDELVELDVGAIIMATGFATMDPSALKQYGYADYPNVLTNLEFERLCNATGPTSGKVLLRDPSDRRRFLAPPKSVAILHCIGSRDRNFHAYCSRTCCMVALKYAHLIKDRVGHNAEVFNFYIDMRCVGKGYEEFYERVQTEGVRMIRGKAARITDQREGDEPEGKLVVIAEDTLAQRLLRVPVDMAILCTAMEPRSDAQETARIFGLTTGNDGFFLEEHPKLEPVSTCTAGIFVAGACQGPKDIPDSVAQAKAAASMAQALITRGEVEASPVISEIDPDLCIGCRICIGLCPYASIDFDARHHLSVVNGAVCKGCGSCAAHCPSGAAKVRHFTDQQIFNEIEGLLLV